MLNRKLPHLISPTIVKPNCRLAVTLATKLNLGLLIAGWVKLPWCYLDNVQFKRLLGNGRSSKHEQCKPKNRCYRFTYHSGRY
ncbi:hypothetical protein A1356_11240 [Methylomonas koyamae]|uniref:Uncharacterized protein n=1 Tax=Methylomonas koyamae TaxID=702114 RepID=A0AA91DDW2_9GAMM|nr:hypothetical protein A1356_11240 [Methylomonas koyamae]